MLSYDVLQVDLVFGAEATQNPKLTTARAARPDRRFPKRQLAIMADEGETLTDMILGSDGTIYVSGALRYGRNTVILPFQFTEAGTTEPLTVEARGRITNIGPMLSLGGQFLLSDALTLDIYTGVGIAITPLSLEVSTDILNTEQYVQLRDQLLNELNANPNTEDLDNFISNNGVKIGFPIVLPLLRIGVAVGYTF